MSSIGFLDIPKTSKVKGGKFLEHALILAVDSPVQDHFQMYPSCSTNLLKELMVPSFTVQGLEEDNKKEEKEVGMEREEKWMN